MVKHILLTLFVLLLNLVAEAEEKRWTPEFMIQFPRVGGTAVSPDGKWVAYTVSRAQTDGEKSEFLTHIWLVSTDGKTDRQYTFGDKSCTNPSFSPDGMYLAFLSARGADNKNQLWVMRVSGGEAEQITTGKTGVGSFAWSNDGNRIAYLMVDPESETKEKERKEKRDIVVVDQDFSFAHIYTTTVGKNKDGMRIAKRLTAGRFHVTSFDWSPDDKTIAFAHQENPTADVWPTTDISLVPSDSGASTRLVGAKGYDSSPRYSRDGKLLAYVSDGGDSRWARATDVYVVPVAGGTPRKLAETLDRSPGILDWSSDGKEIFFSEADKTSLRVFALSVNSGNPRVITGGDGLFTNVSLSKNGSTLAYVFQSSEKPPEVFVSPPASFQPRKLTTIYSSDDLPVMAKTELIRWTSTDGRQIEGLLTYPSGYTSGRRYPLIVNIHGGPAGVFLQYFSGESSVYPLQAFAQEGYAILRPNPRGSGGYGAEFRRANIADWGYGDFEDDMAGVEKVIAMGVAHADSLVICGWSYGGYMTSFAITRTNRFKAASVGAGVTNLMSFVGTSDIPSFLPSYVGGEYWDQIDLYRKHSAMFNVQKIGTPTQILHGEKDVRVPISQGQELYIALKRRGIPTEMITYPRMPHGLTEPKFIVDAGTRVLQWFNTHLRHQQ